MTKKKFEDITNPLGGAGIEPIKGTISPVSFEGGEEPFVVLATKINEIIDWVNKK